MINPLITGIQRSTHFSPNHIGNDAAIFNGVADYLRAKGYPVTVCTEQELISLPDNPQYAFAMLREPAAIRRMQQWELEGCRCVNSAFGIENTGRESMTKRLIEHHIPYPDSIIVQTNEQIIDMLEKRGLRSCWIKRSDFHAIHREDVAYARHAREVQGLLTEYALRGIDRVVINEHLEGDLIKFYGVTGTTFFHWFYPNEKNYSKFGLEKINGKTKAIPFDGAQLHELCLQAAQVLQLIVFGGDCIVSPDGIIHIIDFNDWPSFAPCRSEAIPVIGEKIIEQLQLPNSPFEAVSASLSADRQKRQGGRGM